MKVEGVEKVIKALEHETKKRFDSPGRTKESVIVGYTASYGVYVHETPPSMVSHAPGKQWKFLEEPARRLNNNGELTRIMREVLKKGGKVLQALYMGGLLIQRESQKVVPVDTANLKGSAFTRKES